MEKYRSYLSSYITYLVFHSPPATKQPVILNTSAICEMHLSIEDNLT